MSLTAGGGTTASPGSAGSRLAWVTPVLVVLVDGQDVDSGGTKNIDIGSSQYAS
ncbi:MAG: hypothetical protein QG671_1886 [Actinomycetota bacterium]|nr:hypothetical protein [Actinomycetota bacterium]